MADAAFAPGWLVERPIAHRGLYDSRRGIVENSLAAATAAIEAGYAIECDLQLTADGEAVVFHDWTLQRLTPAHGRVDAMAAEACGRIGYRSGAGTIPTFADLLAFVGGRMPLICEIKSRFDGDLRLARRAVSVAAGYAGPLAFKSFDPLVVATLRNAQNEPRYPVGIVGQAEYGSPEFGALSPTQRHALAHLLHFAQSRPDFISWRVEDLPHAVPFLCRVGMGLPIMTWTVRDAGQADAARRNAGQIVFEGFRP